MAKRTAENYHWVWGVYLLQGLPFALVTSVSPILYKNLGLTNSQIAFYSSLFIFPWIFKFFIAPALEKLASKRTLILVTQTSVALLIFMLAFNLYFLNLFYLNNMIFFLIAIAGSIHDINGDGLYLALNYATQARLIGLRTVFYQLGRLICQGGLVIMVGILETKVDDKLAWSLMIFILGAFILCVVGDNYRKLPTSIKGDKKNFATLWRATFHSYREMLVELRGLPHLWSAVIFLLLYSWPEAQLTKIFPLFLLDPESRGGLNINMQHVGLIQGLGILSMLIGVTVSGFLMVRFTLKKCLVPFTFLLMLSNISYILLSQFSIDSIFLISASVVLGQFAFGLANGAYMLYLINIFSQGTYAMSLYAIGTAIMLLGIMLAGGLSGYFQQVLGYTHFFIWVVFGCVGLIFLANYNARKVL